MNYQEKIRRINFVLCSVFLLALPTRSQTLSWAKQIGGTLNDEGYAVAVDASGNVYTTGYFNGTVDFDPGPGTNNLTSNGAEDIFITKMNASGNIVWAKNMGGTTTEYGRSIAVDASGNIYCIGSFTGTGDFDPGPSTYNLTSAGSSDIFICKLSSSGDLLWAQRYGGVRDDDHGNAITLDASGNLYTTGSFTGTIDFDPGPGTFNLSGNWDIFITKQDTSGHLIWARSMGGNFDDQGFAIAVDRLGNVYTTGSFHGWADLDPGSGTAYFNSNIIGDSDADMFVSKLDASGNYVWAKQLAGWTTHFSYGYGIAVDDAGNVYTTGSFKGTIDFDPGTSANMIPAQGLTDGFALKLNASGDFVWIKILGGCQNEDYGTCITLDGGGNVYTTGVFRYIGDFDPGSGVYELHAQGGTDVFISKLTSSGNFVWAKYLGGGADDYSYAIAIDASGDLYTTGSFQAWSDFDPGPGTTVFTTAGGYDIFVQKMSQSLQTPVLSLVANEYCNVIGIQTFKLLNLPDTPGVSISIKLDATILSLAADSSFSISINNLSPGSHQIEVKYSNATEVKTTTKDFTVIVAQTPDVNVTASATTVADLTPVTVTAINASGGGTTPLFTFGKDKNINILWQAESANNVLVLDPSNLAIGQNRIYVRMKTSVSCYTVSTNIDSVDITRTVATGIRDIDYPNQEISVYPIPFNQSFEIKGLQISKSYSIFLSNSIGQKIFEKNIHNNTNIKITGLFPAGNYWLTIYDKTKMRLLGAIPLIKN